MKNSITITKITSGNRNNPWRVTYYLPNGKRSTRHFKEPQDAKILAAELGMEAVESGFAVSLDERAALAQLRRQAERKGCSSSTVLKLLVDENLKVANSVIPLKQLAEEYLFDLKRIGRRPKTLNHYKGMINAFSVGQENRSIADFSPKSIMSWIRGKYLNTDSQISCKTPLMGMFRWAVQNREEWGLSESWLINQKAKTHSSTAKKRPIVFSPEEVDDLLRFSCPAFRHVLAIQAFGGIRPEELCCDEKQHLLSWETIDFANREILVPWQVSKTKSDALMCDLPDNLWAWLEEVPPALRTGRVCKCCKKTFRRRRHKALLKATNYTTWPKDVLRHSFATYFYFEGGIEHTIACMRHSNRSDMLWKHYLSDVSAIRSEAYFSIFPDKIELDNSEAS